MQVPTELIKVSRSSIMKKLFDTTEEKMKERLKGEELKKALSLLPSKDEARFMEIYQSSIPQLARIQRKMSVCLEAEVLELKNDLLIYEFAGKLFTLKAPSNSFRISEALDVSLHEGFSELCKESCVLVDNVFIKDPDKSGLEVDELRLLVRMANKFFFQIYLA